MSLQRFFSVGGVAVALIVCGTARSATIFVNPANQLVDPAITASQTPHSAAYVASNVFDGIFGTGSGEYATSNAISGDAFIDFDFGAPQTIGGFVFYQRLGGADGVTSFQLVFDDNNDFSSPLGTKTFATSGPRDFTLLNDVSGSRQQFEFPSGVNARYVRWDVVSAIGNGYDGAAEMEFWTAVVVPEPSTAWMALAGLACGGILLWRRGRGVTLSREPVSTCRTVPMLLALLAALALGGAARAAYEIADISSVGINYRGYTKVYLDSGTNPIDSQAEWDAYTPPPGFLKNTPRNAEFNAETTLSSPGLPPPEVTMYTDPSGHTWKFIAQTQSAMWPYASGTNPYQQAALTVTPQPGTVKFSSNEKNQIMTFFARQGDDPAGAPIERFFITDGWGNEYIMGTTAVADDADIPASFAASVLPPGWTKSTGFLAATLHLAPAYGAGNVAHFNLFRESADNTFFQFTWSGSGNTLANQIVDMPIWGGPSNDTIFGRAGDDNLVHGAEGDDTIHSLGLSDTLYGDAGIDTVVLAGDFGEYSLVSYANAGASLVLSRAGLTKTILDAEFLHFDDGLISTAAVPEPVAFSLPATGLAVAGFSMWQRRKRA